MRLLKRAFVVGSLALSSVVVPVAPPALASDCAGAVTFVSGTPTQTPRPVERVAARFATRGPGFLYAHCDAGWVTTCELFVDGLQVPATCSTSYDPEPHLCPSEPWCAVEVGGYVAIESGKTHVVRARLGMRWGCCNFRMGPEAVAEGTWHVAGHFDASSIDCDDWVPDVCQTVRDPDEHIPDNPLGRLECPVAYLEGFCDKLRKPYRITIEHPIDP